MTRETTAILHKYRFSVADYHQMAEKGILAPDARVELINGEIIEMSPINSPHAGMVKKLNHLLSSLLNESILLGIQDPIEISGTSEPEPDLSILKMRADFYSKSHPTAADVIFLVEVADSSLEKDRQIKLPLYAAAGIPEVWIVNLAEKTVEVYTQPSPQGYSQIHLFRQGDSLHTNLVKELAVDQLFPD